MPKYIRTRPGSASDRTVRTLIFLALIPAITQSQVSSEVVLGERLAHEYEEKTGLGNTPELNGISSYISSVGSRVASALPSHPQYHLVFDPNPAFKSAFALPGGYIVVGGGLLALAQTEDGRTNALADEIKHVELVQVSKRVTELTKQKNIKKPASE